ncbi:MAG: amidohydrolase [Chloroflexi bacterium]|nr:amidohydrolase [Chloroflexota bacterium]MCC6892626.1 amidohydrolase [Anaerolineae bacterium]
MTSILLNDAYVLCLGQADRVFPRGYVLIEDDRIADVGDMAALPNRSYDERIDASGKLVMPGLVNAHTHTPMTLFRGLAEGVSLFTLDGWYNTIRTLELVMTPDMVPAAVAVACAEMIRTGTTTFADQYFFMDQVIPTVRQSGLRAALGYGVVELGDPAARERELVKLEGFLEEMGGKGEGRVQGWIGPHAFFVDNSLELMERERILAEKYGVGFHIHLSTTGEEDEICERDFGMSAVQKMAALGMLDRPVIAAHSVTIPAADWSTLARYPFTAVTCPSASMRAGADAAPIVGMRSAGVNIALGTDNVCNSNDYDLFGEMRTLAKLASFREKTPGALPARDVLAIATEGGAKALGLADQIGDLTVGKQADLILLDRSGIGWQPYSANDPFTALVYSIHGLQVTDTMVAGRWLLRDQAWTTLDYPTAARELDGHAKRLLELRDQSRS